MVVQVANLIPAPLENLLRFPARLAKDELRLTLGLLADLPAKLLGADERVVERLVALPERTKLLVKSLRLRLELLRLPRQALQLLRHLLAELLHAFGIVSAQRPTEIVPPDIERCEMKSLVH